MLRAVAERDALLAQMILDSTDVVLLAKYVAAEDMVKRIEAAAYCRGARALYLGRHSLGDRYTPYLAEFFELEDKFKITSGEKQVHTWSRATGQPIHTSNSNNMCLSSRPASAPHPKTSLDPTPALRSDAVKAYSLAQIEPKSVLRGLSLAIAIHVHSSTHGPDGPDDSGSDDLAVFDETNFPEAIVVDDEDTSLFVKGIPSPEKVEPVELVNAIERFVHRLYYGLEMDPECLVIACSYITRFLRMSALAHPSAPSALSMRTARPLVATACLLACKTFYDDATFVGDFAEFAGGCKDWTLRLVKCELRFLQRIEFDVTTAFHLSRFAEGYFKMLDDVKREAKAASSGGSTTLYTPYALRTRTRTGK
ncbi:hypothetical protein T492DRAFT_1146695 [Pavlovales sp. CCMP2436]|nr:hypothetical protein T492DRAFT_1146695 [Pavlovales sp. CCMP2436]